jgi:two-component system, cell cycle sensor histidine kinase and response regulator CckA
VTGAGETLDKLLESGLLHQITVSSSGIPVEFPPWMDIDPLAHIESSFPLLCLSSRSVQQVAFRDSPDAVFSAMVIPLEGGGRSIFFSGASVSVEKAEDPPRLSILQQRAMEAIPDILILKDPSGKWIHSNSIASQLLAETENSHHSAPVLSPDCPESDRTAWQSDTYVRRDETLPDGRIYDVTKTALRNTDGSPFGLVVLARNVTEARNREAAQRRLGQTLETLLAVDRAVLHSSSPQELLDSVTEALASHGIFSRCGGRIEPFEGYPAPALQTPPSLNAIQEPITHGVKKYGMLEAEPLPCTNVSIPADCRMLLSQAAHELGMALGAMETRAESARRGELLDAFLEHLPGPAFIRNSQSVYLRVNRSFNDLFAGADWIGKDPLDLYEGESLELLRKTDRKVLRNGYVTKLRLIACDPSNPRNIEMHYFRIDPEGGEPLIGGLGIDVTEKLRTQQELRRSEETHRAIYENTGTAMAIIGTDGTVVSVNSRIEALTGYSEAEIVGRMAWSDFVHSDDLEMVARKRAERLRASPGHQMEYQFRLVRKNGELRHIRMHTGTIPGTGGTGVISLTDVTSLITYQDELNALLAKMKAILRAIPDFIFIVSTSGTYVDYLSGEDSLLAIGRNELIGRSIADIGLPEEKVSEVLRTLSAAAITGTVQNIQYTLDVKGSLRTYQASMAPFQEDLVLALCRDITEERALEQRERELEAQVMHVQKLESLGVLAGGIAHDFNNILMAVTGNVHLARQALKNGGHPGEYLDIIEKAAARASGLAGQMLAYAGRGEFFRGPVDMNAMASEITEILGASVSKKAVFEFYLDPDLPMVMADENQLRQVIMNLVTNASEALEERAGRIAISTGVRYCDEDYIATLSITEAIKPGCYAWIEVKDTGKGMDEDTLSRIFDPFFTTKFAGRGLGLSAVLGIIGSHCGGLGVISRPGVGSCFRALFPVSSFIDSPEDEPLRGSSAWKGSGTVLFIDDELVLLAVAREMIGSMGFRVVTASDGMEGLERYRELQGEIVLVVTDLTMPRMDGDRLLREIRRQGSKVPVIVSSGYSASEILSRFPEDPPDGFLKKPYSASEIQVKIRSLLSHR